MKLLYESNQLLFTTFVRIRLMFKNLDLFEGNFHCSTIIKSFIVDDQTTIKHKYKFSN